MKHHSLQLYDYHVWANEMVFKHLKELPQEIYHKEVQSVFPSISEALAHIYIVDNNWLYAMSGDSFNEIMMSADRLKEETKGKSIEEIETIFFNLSKRYKAFFNRKQDMEIITSYIHPRFGKLEARYSDIVQHIVNHGTYHRGNITAILRQLGHPGTSTDYVFYLYFLNRLITWKQGGFLNDGHYVFTHQTDHGRRGCNSF